MDEMKGLRRDDFLTLRAETVNAEGDDIAGVEEFLRLHAHADAGWCAGGDDVAGMQRHQSGNIGNDFRNVEDHGRG